MREEKYSTAAKRFGAAILDGIIFLPLILFEQLLSGLTQNTSVLNSWTLFATFAPILYSIILHYKYGQTVGKWAFAIKVLHISEKRTLTLKESILRDIGYLLLEIFAICYLLFLLKQNDDFYTFPRFDDLSTGPLFIWNVIELITMLTNSKRRAIHDFIAKSVVVRTIASG
jgi:uncharacterized RDD family membrane protein YckC